jgi:tRNA(Ile)-lysidine synthase
MLEDVLGGGVAEALARTADQLRSDSAYLDDVAAAIESPLRVDTLRDLAPALRSRVLRRTALDAGADGSALTATHLAELDRLVTNWHGQVRIELPGGIACHREGDSLSYTRTPVGG